MSTFYSRLSYSFGNEDSQTEQKALQIEPNNRILCITASGDRPLNLLQKPCKEIVSIDLNNVQNYLLELKKAAMAALDEEEYQAFLGINPCISRKKTFLKIAPQLTSKAQDYWKQNLHHIHKGVIFRGVIEQWTIKGASPLRYLRRKELKNLFSFNAIEEQQDFMKHQWSHKFWKPIFKCVLNPWLSRIILRDPGMYAYLDSSMSPGMYLYQRFIKCLNHSLAKENPMVSLILTGGVPHEALPPYLKPTIIPVIKSRLDKINIINADVISYLEGLPDNSFDRFSLSDVSSYLDHTQFLRLLKAMFRTAKPGARFCLRQLMTRYKIPEGLKPYFATEPKLEQELENEEKAFFYHFTVGKILKD